MRIFGLHLWVRIAQFPRDMLWNRRHKWARMSLNRIMWNQLFVQANIFKRRESLMKLFSRAGGLLLHPSSLPGPYGIGDLGPQAYRFVDWLVSTGCTLWQVLPLGPTGYGDSPYQCFSAFAGNPYLVSFDTLIEDGFLTEEDF